MRVLGLLLARNAESRVHGALDSLADCADAIYVLNDRSTDSTLEILESHPLVANVFSSDPELSASPWFYSESMCLSFLYRMADFFAPDWIVMLSDDDTLADGRALRYVIESAGGSVVGYELERVSTWNDPEFPLMVPLMSKARAWDCRVWRHFRDLSPGTQWLHNGYHPPHLEQFGSIARTSASLLLHHGWNTLQARLDKVRQYRALDPDGIYNRGVPYDRGLLFGYGESEIGRLVAEYHRRLRLHVTTESL